MRFLVPALAALLLAAPAVAAEPTASFRSNAAKTAVPVQPRQGTFQPRKLEAERAKQRSEALTQRIKALRERNGGK
ncbi:exported hypothetical protein [uncultured Alphaproteobacteria bacterium]|uniref:Uncharacterized protein n=1 Tax=uncultured Alphaproteobacteria bacterium TaxID=91750 RepID=A0A212JE26_9PROT|nr:exported hypothetical protein [uncultured Alphaproteobacteria bacterium]